MLGSAAPATATLHTSTSSATPSSPTRPSRLRGLSYLRSYTHNHLHSHSSSTVTVGGRGDLPPLTRSTSSPTGATPATSPKAKTRSPESDGSTTESSAASGIQSGENGWLPTVQGRSGLSRASLHPTSTSTESASPEPNASNSVGMTRSRAATALGPTPTMTSPTLARRQSAIPDSSTSDPLADSMAESSSTAKRSKRSLPRIRFIPHIEPRSTRPSLNFTMVEKTLEKHTNIVRVGRYSERDNAHPEPNTLPVGFKSKVVSRRHCEFWCANGQWYVRDVRSSSGTFLNHVRLSPPGQESRPYTVKDGDVVQLGIDFKGGEELIYRCVKIRVECNRDWQNSLNAYNTTAHKRLLKNTGVAKGRDSDAASVNSSECSICLNAVQPLQALFVAPCSHVWHYKCVKDLVDGESYPNFLCPNCRFVANLEADVEGPEEGEEQWEEEVEVEAEVEAEAGGRGQEHCDGQPGSRDEAGGRRASTDGPDEEARRHDGDAELKSTPKTIRRANVTDEDLAGLLSQASLQSSRQSSSNALTPDPNSDTFGSSAASSRPVTIAGSSSHHHHQRTPSASDLLGARSTTPTSTAQFALAAGVMMGDGPMTPRNDAGPFVLDGSGGSGRARIDATVAVRQVPEGYGGE
ncbi:hypothetical protein LTR36_002122 [Oleoguttula mirabilis]|uniref:Uncharacterized protein n=1 Tax=Oleoguttula mirabilis TaxID=1507867 RepID=A0AAV9JNB9_9PEZI|nr:hypothetical protein LTR36_002122 [Oleoguttula mirabilis]